MKPKALDMEHIHLGSKSICILKMGRYKNKKHKKGNLSKKPFGDWNIINASGSWEKNSSQGHVVNYPLSLSLNVWYRCTVNDVIANGY